MHEDISSDIKALMPQLRGRLESNALLAPYSWLRVGGLAQLFFSPKDEDDLSYFLSRLPEDIPVMPLGVGSNLIIRDGGIKGVVIRLGPAFGKMAVCEDQTISIGAACLDKRVALFAAQNNIGGLSFLAGIPGAIGGALRMNAGAHGGEITDCFKEATALTRQGDRITLSHEDMRFVYRNSSPKDALIFTSAILQGKAQVQEVIEAEITHIEKTRLATQPIKERTAGSTFKNPKPHSAWKLIDAAGMRGAAVGGAQMSQMHCNFLINKGDATAHDLESLGEIVRQKVFENSGVLLEWEVKRIGEFAEGYGVEAFRPST